MHMYVGQEQSIKHEQTKQTHTIYPCVEYVFHLFVEGSKKYGM
jgi:hypothetical protein